MAVKIILRLSRCFSEGGGGNGSFSLFLSGGYFVVPNFYEYRNFFDTYFVQFLFVASDRTVFECSVALEILDKFDFWNFLVSSI